MATRKKTLRRMPEKTRKYAKLINELQSITLRLKRMTEEVQQLELDSKALRNHTCIDMKERSIPDGKENLPLNDSKT